MAAAPLSEAELQLLQSTVEVLNEQPLCQAPTPSSSSSPIVVDFVRCGSKLSFQPQLLWVNRLSSFLDGKQVLAAVPPSNSGSISSGAHRRKQTGTGDRSTHQKAESHQRSLRRIAEDRTTKTEQQKRTLAHRLSATGANSTTQQAEKAASAQDPTQDD